MISIADVAITRLSESCCTEYELRLYLQKEFQAQPNVDHHIEFAMQKLKDSELVNDLRLATNLAQRYANKGNRLISQMLRQKGISEEVIERVLSSLDNENVRALSEAQKKLNGQWDRSEKAMTGLHRFLSGRSFSYHVIDSVLGQLSEQRACAIN
ncbi:MAG: regulatory protein RecX [Tatlockia sp.]|jgi:regulatory protein